MEDLCPEWVNQKCRLVFRIYAALCLIVNLSVHIAVVGPKTFMFASVWALALTALTFTALVINHFI